MFVGSAHVEDQSHHHVAALAEKTKQIASAGSRILDFKSYTDLILVREELLVIVVATMLLMLPEILSQILVICVVHFN